jgi:hypothetical protein
MRIALFSIAVASLVVGCGQRSRTPVTKPTTIRTDAAPITLRLPKLGSLQSVRWQSAEITKNSFPSPPTHPACQIWGLAQLEKGKAEDFTHNYEWQKMPAGWMPNFMDKNADVSLTNWYHSAAFTKDCKPPELPGELFFERLSGVVYFSIETK